jgi:hypothetical protein
MPGWSIPHRKIRLIVDCPGGNFFSFGFSEDKQNPNRHWAAAEK